MVAHDRIRLIDPLRNAPREGRVLFGAPPEVSRRDVAVLGHRGGAGFMVRVARVSERAPRRRDGDAWRILHLCDVFPATGRPLAHQDSSPRRGARRHSDVAREDHTRTPG